MLHVKEENQTVKTTLNDCTLTNDKSSNPPNPNLRSNTSNPEPGSCLRNLDMPFFIIIIMYVLEFSLPARNPVVVKKKVNPFI